MVIETRHIMIFRLWAVHSTFVRCQVRWVSVVSDILWPSPPRDRTSMSSLSHFSFHLTPSSLCILFVGCALRSLVITAFMMIVCLDWSFWIITKETFLASDHFGVEEPSCPFWWSIHQSCAYYILYLPSFSHYLNSALIALASYKEVQDDLLLQMYNFLNSLHDWPSFWADDANWPLFIAKDMRSIMSDLVITMNYCNIMHRCSIPFYKGRSV